MCPLTLPADKACGLFILTRGSASAAGFVTVSTLPALVARLALTALHSLWSRSPTAAVSDARPNVSSTLSTVMVVLWIERPPRALLKSFVMPPNSSVDGAPVCFAMFFGAAIVLPALLTSQTSSSNAKSSNSSPPPPPALTAACSAGGGSSCFLLNEFVKGDWLFGESDSEAPASSIFHMVGDKTRGEWRGELLLGLELAYPSELCGRSRCERISDAAINLPLLDRGLLLHFCGTCRASGAGESRFDPSNDPVDPCDDMTDLPSNANVDIARVLEAESAESCACATSCGDPAYEPVSEPCARSTCCQSTMRSYT